MINTTDLQLNPCECSMLNDFELYNINAESAEIEKNGSFSIQTLIMLSMIGKNYHQIE